MTVALVTGAASGLGHGLVEVLLARGDDVVAVDVAPIDGARSFVCDVRDRAALERVRDEVGPVDLLFNNAGISGSDSARIVEVNLGGVINGCEVFHTAARVINTASLLGVRPSPRRATYSASKAGVIAYSLALHELGVAVSIVLPHVRSAIERDDPDGPEAAYVAMGADPVDAAAEVLRGVDAGNLWIVAGTDPVPILAQVAHFPQ